MSASSTDPLRIAVFGAGRVGAGLGRAWAEAGHDIVVTFSRDPESLKETAESIGARSAEPEPAVRGADVVVLAVPWAVAQDALDAAGDLTDKLVIDCTNNVSGGEGPSCAERIAEMAPGARVVKAFNTLFAMQYDEIASASPTPQGLYCGDGADAKATVARLVRDAGYDPVDAGPLGQAKNLEAMARLVIHMAYEQGKGPMFYWFGRQRPGEFG